MTDPITDVKAALAIDAEARRLERERVDRAIRGAFEYWADIPKPCCAKCVVEDVRKRIEEER